MKIAVIKIFKIPSLGYCYFPFQHYFNFTISVMKRAFSLAFIFSLLYNLSIAQPGKLQKTAVNPYEVKLKTITEQLLAVVNEKAPMSNLTGTKAPKAKYRSIEYPAPALAFPGGLDTTLSRTLKWEGAENKNSWVWSTTLMRYPKGTQTEKLKAELMLLSKAMAKLYPAATKRSEMKEADAYEGYTAKGFYIEFYTSYLHTYDAPAYLKASLYFNTPQRQTREQLADSLRKDLDKQVAITYPAKNKIDLIVNWSYTLEAIGFDKATVLSHGRQVFQQIASKDIKLAYAMLMEWPNADDLVSMTAGLSPSQKEQIRMMSQEDLNAFYNNSSKEPEPTVKKAPEPVAPQKEETDPCKIEVAALTFRPGHWIYGQGRSAIVFNYNCGIHLYTIAWMNSKGNLEFEADVSKESLASRYQLAEGYQAYKFIICRDCAGKGYGYGYDRASSYIGSLRIEYNTGKLVRQSCGYCGGKGCMKVN